MELDEVIKNRRTIREFKSDEISDEEIEYILNNARLSPSAENKQPWHYYIFKGEQKDSLFTLISEYITNKSELTYYEKIMRKRLTTMKNAPVIILVYSSLEENELNDYISLGSSIEHICLSAHNHNIGSLWLGVIIEFEELIKEHYHIDNMKLISSVVLGYPNEDPDERPRKDILEIVTYM